MKKTKVYLILIITIIIFLIIILLINKNLSTKSNNQNKNKTNKNELCTNYTDNYDEYIANSIVLESQKYLNVPYIFGSKYSDINSINPKEKYLGIDCSDFVENVLETVIKQEYESTAAELAYQLKGNCVKLSDIKKGDIIFWNDILNKRVYERFGNIFHVGIYLGNNRIIEATTNSSYGINGVVYGDLFRNRGGLIIMIARPY